MLLNLESFPNLYSAL